MKDFSDFHAAQADADEGIATALSELRAGRKRSHWIWYVFPQLEGLGSSPMARHFALAGPEEAAEWLRDPVLSERLLQCAEAVLLHSRGPAPAPLRVLLGSSVDALKLVSSMTLFASVARRLAEREGEPHPARLASVARQLLEVAASQGIPPCAHTLRALESAGFAP